MSTIDRYIFKQFIPPFIFGLLIFTFSITINRILLLTQMVLNKGVSITAVLKLASLTIPDFMIITLPVSFLLAVLTVFGKMTQDNEIMALKVSGVSVFKLTKPALLFALIPFAVSILFSFYMAPRFNFFFRVLAVKEFKKAALSALKKNAFTDKFGKLKIFVRDVDTNKSTLKGIFILNRVHDTPETLIAKKGAIVYNQKQNTLYFYLKNGIIQNQNPNSKNFWMLHFNTYKINIKLKGLSFPGKNGSVHFMTFSELARRYLSEKNSKLKNIYLIYLYKKIAIPLAAILFVFIGMSLGMLLEKRSLFLAISYTIIIVVSYYILFTSGFYLSLRNQINPVIGVWGADLFLFIFGFILYLRTLLR
ncbi:MAG: LptF/LptG family permease [Deltaproteobacteria bacterium]|nr:LptF/LptG family permease [Deltaproteobacteria bacterium]MCL5880639.1 LptF/LptG family permease [Deltaproteobacteria bacterium]MDA8305150.1 LptF/LptG family permease [Deltaproteobacteria bacterium]